MMCAIRLAGWDVDSVAIFPDTHFPPEEWGPLDIVLASSSLPATISSDVVFADFHAARLAARDPQAVATMRLLIRRLNPDIIHFEHPWPWLLLREALPSSHRIRLVYSSQNVEWRARQGLLRIGMRNQTSDDMLEATRLLELESTTAADLVLSISDIEADEMQRMSGRDVIYLPPVSDLTRHPVGPSRFAIEARVTSCRYCALMGSAYWPNVEGFFDLFPAGLGFLAQGEQIWVAGTLGRALQEDRRFRDFWSVNEMRFRDIGYLEVGEKGDFFTTAACVVVPVTFGGGAKMKTADAIASGLPVIATRHALEGYGPIVAPALGNGVYVADTPAEFRAFIREALRKGLPGCSASVRSQLSLETMSTRWSQHAKRLVAPPPALRRG